MDDVERLRGLVRRFFGGAPVLVGSARPPELDGATAVTFHVPSGAGPRVVRAWAAGERLNLRLEPLPARPSVAPGMEAPLPALQRGLRDLPDRTSQEWTSP